MTANVVTPNSACSCIRPLRYDISLCLSVSLSPFLPNVALVRFSSAKSTLGFVVRIANRSRGGGGYGGVLGPPALGRRSLSGCSRCGCGEGSAVEELKPSHYQQDPE